jgi:hypothetical protein
MADTGAFAGRLTERLQHVPAGTTAGCDLSEAARSIYKGANMKLNSGMLVLITVVASLCTLQGCAQIIYSAATAERPRTQTEESCKEWECWNGTSCGQCPQEDAKKTPAKKSP